MSHADKIVEMSNNFPRNKYIFRKVSDILFLLSVIYYITYKIVFRRM